MSLLVRKLQDFGALSDQETRAVEIALLGAQQLEGNQDLAHEGGRPAFCPLVINGFACRYKMLRNGQRQIAAFHVPGDF